MRLLVLCVCLSAGSLAQSPQKCTSPRLLTGGLSVFTPSDELMAFAKYSYDAVGQRIHLRKFVSSHNETSRVDALLLYTQGVGYDINYSNNTCYKKALAVDFHPLATPPNASLVGQLVMGSSPGLGRGVLVNTWVGELQINEKTAKYVSTVTELGCVPVSTLLHTSASGWLVTSFFNNVIGPADPQLFVPPPLCADAQLEQTGEPVTFFSWF